MIIDERWSVEMELTEDEYCALVEVTQRGPRIRPEVRMTIEEEDAVPRVITGDRCRLVLR
ncbi:hypothetical protein GQ464_017085 [Rhodocaloribacter litoris]|uniref:hypothetical protein n=1 Tax=Rhodocaloribacter litoris TaxID=2558931 RepID=UPI00141EF0BE|nr:hypothetical protein [Rhodocaloribacter litoris]QXD15097.1 hypothetical protein GQ464_017085 [Rhodocaloribacter litoris]